MVNDLVDELNTALVVNGWSMREFARRADMSHALVSQVINRTAPVSADFCIKTAHALDWRPEHALRLAGILDPLPPESVHDGEAMALFRKLAPALQHVVIDCMKSMQSLQCIELAPQELDEDRTYIAAAGHLVDTMPIPALRRIVGRLLDHIEREQEREREQTTHVVTP